jgi:hypothetical protein
MKTILSRQNYYLYWVAELGSEVTRLQWQSGPRNKDQGHTILHNSVLSGLLKRAVISRKAAASTDEYGHYMAYRRRALC